MNVSRLTFHERGTLAQADEVGLWKILKRLLSDDLKALEREMDEHPQTCESDWKKDQKWKYAQAALLRRILRLPEEARSAMEPKDSPENPGG